MKSDKLLKGKIRRGCGPGEILVGNKVWGTIWFLLIRGELKSLGEPLINIPCYMIQLETLRNQSSLYMYTLQHNFLIRIPVLKRQLLFQFKSLFLQA